MEVSRSSLTFFQRNHALKGPFAVQRIVLRYALKVLLLPVAILLAKTLTTKIVKAGVLFKPHS